MIDVGTGVDEELDHAQVTGAGRTPERARPLDGMILDDDRALLAQVWLALFQNYLGSCGAVVFSRDHEPRRAFSPRSDHEPLREHFRPERPEAPEGTCLYKYV